MLFGQLKIVLNTLRPISSKNICYFIHKSFSKFNYSLCKTNHCSYNKRMG